MKTVTFKGSTDRAVEVVIDDKHLPLNVPVEGITDDQIKRLGEIEGHEFEVDGKPQADKPTPKTKED